MHMRWAEKGATILLITDWDFPFWATILGIAVLTVVILILNCGCAGGT